MINRNLFKPYYGTEKFGEMRTVVNLKRFNIFVKYFNLKMDNVNSLIDTLRHLDFITRIDLKGAYFTVPLHCSSTGVVIFTSSPFCLLFSHRIPVLSLSF